MLTKKEIEALIDNQNASLKIVEPTVTQKSLDVWNFSQICVKYMVYI